MKYLLVYVLTCPLLLFGQSKKDEIKFNYSSLALPDSLRKEAHEVVRMDESIYDVSAPGKYKLKSHEVITLLDKKGERHLRQVFGIDKFHKMEDLEVKVYNSIGAELKKYKKKDFATVSPYDGINLVTDDKVMVLNIPSPGYPCTIEITTEMEVTSFIQFPVWLFQYPDQIVETSRLEIRLPETMDLRYKVININIEPTVQTEKDRKKYVWEVHNLKDFQVESGSAPRSGFPVLMLAATQFEYDGHRGNMNDWKGLGIWYNELVKSTNRLSDKNAAEIKNLVAKASNDREKIRILYDFLQHNFRYVSIQLGIGGFQPFPADFVHEKKYGDCKGLSNYMQACLSAVGINSYSAWINAGANQLPVDPDFPYDGFNHQILCIPIQKDTIWLECTSNFTDFGHLGNFTENRNALLLTENGGVLVCTPKSLSKDNQYKSFTRIVVEPEGTGTSKTNIEATGEFKYEQLAISKEKLDDQKTYFIRGLGFPNADFFELKIGERSPLPVNTKVEMEFEKIHEFSAGSKMFLKPRLARIWSEKLPDSEKRTREYLFDFPFIKIDTTVYQVPEDYGVEVLPEERKLDCGNAQFHTKYWYDKEKNEIYSIARLELNTHYVQPARFEETRRFFEDVINEGNQRIVIKKGKK